MRHDPAAPPPVPGAAEAQAAAAQEELAGDRLRSAHADLQKQMEQLKTEQPSSVFLTGD